LLLLRVLDVIYFFLFIILIYKTAFVDGEMQQPD